MSEFSDKWLKELLARNDQVKLRNEPDPPAPRTVMAAEKDTDKLAREFEEAWAWAGGPDLDTEHKFHPVRKWRFDYAHPATKIAIELEGGIRPYRNKEGELIVGRHLRGDGFTDDCAKYNEAALLGWTVFRIPTGGVDPALLERIGKLIEQRIAATDIPF